MGWFPPTAEKGVMPKYELKVELLKYFAFQYLIEDPLVLLDIQVGLGVQDVGGYFQRIGSDRSVLAKLAQIVDHLLGDRIHPVTNPEVVFHPIPDVVKLANVHPEETEDQGQVELVSMLLKRFYPSSLMLGPNKLLSLYRDPLLRGKAQKT